jgi:KDO2-lipid IV(A) lauroyltransferase
MDTQNGNKGKKDKKGKFSPVKLLGWWISAKALRFFSFLIQSCPERLLPKLGDGLGVIAFYVLPHLRNIGVDNIKKVFGSKISKSEIRILIKASLKNISRNIIELAYCCVSSQPQRFLRQNISVIGKENLDKALKKGRGVITVSAHLGNFPIVGAYMADLGYPFWIINKDPENIYLKNLFKQWMDHLGIRSVPYKPRRICVSESIRVLRNNGVIFLQVDQNPRKKHGVYVEFFGYHLPTYSGLVVMALRTGAAIVPMFIHRNADNTETITIQPEVSLKKSKDKSQNIVDNLRIINIICEDWIRRYPEQWWWIHRRFRRALKLENK